MAKKYLLYIHDERFSDEPNKSQLVNELLANHYAQFRGMPNPRKDGLPPVVVLPQVIKTKQDAVKAVKVLRCRGNHFMARVDCGLANCPWGNVK